MSILVTGGAGYIGSHVVQSLIDAGERVVVADDFSTGDRRRVAGIPTIEVDLSESSTTGMLSAAMRRHGVSAVIHLAAKKRVDESVARPDWYYRQNVIGLINLLDAMRGADVTRWVFSSSAAVYGAPSPGLVREDSLTLPISPYGETKLIGEWLARDASTAWGFSGIALRYFNVAGAGRPDLGDPSVMNLVTIAFDRLTRALAPQVYGADFPTPDGSGVRDYVHVADLASAHLAALALAERRPGGSFEVFNVGTGVGHSVFEVLAAVSRATGIALAPEVVSRRAGDAATVVADVSRLAEQLGWRAAADLDHIVASAWEAWQHAHQDLTDLGQPGPG